MLHIFQFAKAVIRSTLISAHKVSVTQMQMRLVALRRGPPELMGADRALGNRSLINVNR